jgi:hypothetical protein
MSAANIVLSNQMYYKRLKYSSVFINPIQKSNFFQIYAQMFDFYFKIHNHIP